MYISLNRNLTHIKTIQNTDSRFKIFGIQCNPTVFGKGSGWFRGVCSWFRSVAQNLREWTPETCCDRCHESALTCIDRNVTDHSIWILQTVLNAAADNRMAVFREGWQKLYIIMRWSWSTDHKDRHFFSMGKTGRISSSNRLIGFLSQFVTSCGAQIRRNISSYQVPWSNGSNAGKLEGSVRTFGLLFKTRQRHLRCSELSVGPL